MIVNSDKRILVASTTVGLYAFLLLSVFLPYSYLNKIVYIFIVCIFFLYLVANKLILPRLCLAPIFFILIHLIYTAVALYNYDLSEYTVQFLLSSFLILLLYPVVVFKINIEGMIIHSGLLIALVSLFFFVLFSVLNWNPSLEIFRIMDLAIGFREFGAYTFPMIQLSSAPVLVVAYGLSALKWLDDRSFYSFFISLLILFAILVSGQRGVFLLGLLSFIIIFYTAFKSSRIIQILFSLLLITLFYHYLDIIAELFSASDFSNRIKTLHVHSYINNTEIHEYFFGRGLGSSYYTEGYGRVASVTEITILDSVRYFGVFTFIWLWLLILNPSIMCGKFASKIDFRVGIFIGYVILSISNPVLFNSFGMFVLVWYWSLFFSKKNMQEVL